jgi:hypothetical protein
MHRIVIRISTAAVDLGDPEHQQEIAALAYQFWLERGFRRGSPEEDLLRALCAFPRLHAGEKDHDHR